MRRSGSFSDQCCGEGSKNERYSLELSRTSGSGLREEIRIDGFAWKGMETNIQNDNYLPSVFLLNLPEYTRAYVKVDAPPHAWRERVMIHSSSTCLPDLMRGFEGQAGQARAASTPDSTIGVRKRSTCSDERPGLAMLCPFVLTYKLHAHLCRYS